jgi:hypothetical protein
MNMQTIHTTERSRKVAQVASAGLALLFLIFGVAKADAAASRAEYIAQADPICESGLVRENAALAKYRKEQAALIKKGRKGAPILPAQLRSTARYFNRFSRIEGKVTQGLSPLVAAPGDEALIATWIGKRRQVVDLTHRATRPLVKGNRKKFMRLLTAALEADRQSGVLMQDFGFSHCTSNLPLPGG